MVGSWVATYLTVGLAWCLFNANSKFFRSISEKAYTDGGSSWIVLAFLVWSVLWPIGLVGDTIHWAEKAWKRRRS